MPGETRRAAMPAPPRIPSVTRTAALPGSPPCRVRPDDLRRLAHLPCRANIEHRGAALPGSSIPRYDLFGAANVQNGTSTD